MNVFTILLNVMSTKRSKYCFPLKRERPRSMPIGTPIKEAIITAVPETRNESNVMPMTSGFKEKMVWNMQSTALSKAFSNVDPSFKALTVGNHTMRVLVVDWESLNC